MLIVLVWKPSSGAQIFYAVIVAFASIGVFGGLYVKLSERIEGINFTKKTPVLSQSDRRDRLSDEAREQWVYQASKQALRTGIKPDLDSTSLFSTDRTVQQNRVNAAIKKGWIDQATKEKKETQQVSQDTLSKAKSLFSEVESTELINSVLSPPVAPTI